MLLLLVVIPLTISGCTWQGSDVTLSEWIEQLENWRLPGLREEVPEDEYPDAGAEFAIFEEEAAAEAAALAEAQEAALLDIQSSLLGEWSELSDSLPLFRPIVSWYGSLKLARDGTFRSASTSGTWELSLDGTQLILHGTRGRTVADIVQDGSYLKLSIPDLHLVFLRSGELSDYKKERFVCVKISLDNVNDYISKPVNIGVILDEKDRPTKESAWVVNSPVFDTGLVYYGRSEDFEVTFQNNATGSRSISIPYDTLPLATGATFGHITAAKGTLVFIRAEYVEDNRMTDARTRTLTFTDGTTHTTSLTWYSDLASYTDWQF